MMSGLGQPVAKDGPMSLMYREVGSGIRSISRAFSAARSHERSPSHHSRRSTGAGSASISLRWRLSSACSSAATSSWMRSPAHVILYAHVHGAPPTLHFHHPASGEIEGRIIAPRHAAIWLGEHSTLAATAVRLESVKRASGLMLSAEGLEFKSEARPSLPEIARQLGDAAVRPRPQPA